MRRIFTRLRNSTQIRAFTKLKENNVELDDHGLKLKVQHTIQRKNTFLLLCRWMMENVIKRFRCRYLRYSFSLLRFNALYMQELSRRDEHHTAVLNFQRSKICHMGYVVSFGVRRISLVRHFGAWQRSTLVSLKRNSNAVKNK